MRPLALALVLVACSDFQLETVKDPAGDGLATLVAEPGALEYGVLATASPVARTVTLASVGTAPVTVEGLEFSGSSAYAVTWTDGDVVLDPGETVDVVVTFTPLTHDDQGTLTVVNDGSEPRVLVPLTGAGSVPAIAIDPSSLTFRTQSRVPVSGEVVVSSVGTADLHIASTTVEGAGFAATGDIPAVLRPGETTTLEVTWTPETEGAVVEGKLWLTTNTPAGLAVVPLSGLDEPPCVGLGEAWDRGLLDAYTLSDGLTFYVEDLSAQEDVCIDRWYVWLAEGSQDLGAGDMTGDFGGPYPEGRLGIGASAGLSFDAGGSTGASWWCMEQTQYTQPRQEYTFTGARVPEPLLSHMLDRDQDAVWDWMERNPVPLAARWTNYIQVPTGGGSAAVSLRVLNMGGRDVVTEVRETVPAGWAASDFSKPPSRTESDQDGATVYVFDVALDARQETGLFEHTIYDEVAIDYTLTTPACSGRQTLPEMETRWTDTDGVARSGTANPLIVDCR